MHGDEAILVLILLVHVGLVFWTFRVVEHASIWRGGKKTFAKVTAVAIPIIGSVLIQIAAGLFGKSSAGDSNLTHSIDLAAGSSDGTGLGGDT